MNDRLPQFEIFQLSLNSRDLPASNPVPTRFDTMKMPRYAFNPSTQIPSLAGKVALVTGANVGIGKQTALDLSKHHPAQVWVAARNVQSGNEAVAEIKAIASPGTSVKLLEMDLGSFSSVQAAARIVAAESNRLDILVLNAGMMGGHPGVTKEGYERNFGVNHMGHALLLKLLTPLLLGASENRIGLEPRVVILSSAGHRSSVIPHGGIDFSTLSTSQANYSGVARYCQSKLANAVFPAPVAKRHPEFTTVSVNPGEVNTELFSKGASGGGWLQQVLRWVVAPLVGGSVEDGAKNSLWAATAKGVKSGSYYDPVGKAGGESGLVKNGKLGEELWEWTQKELKGYEL